MLLYFKRLALVGSLCRLLYFGVPNSILESEETPVNVEVRTELASAVCADSMTIASRPCLCAMSKTSYALQDLFPCSLLFFFLPLLPMSCYRISFLRSPNPICLQRFTRAWGFLLLQSIFFLAGNVCFYGTYGIIIILWAQAYRTLQRRRMEQQNFLRLYRILLGSYGLLQVVLVLLIIVSSYLIFAIAHAIVLCLLSVFATVAISVLYSRLHAALQPQGAASAGDPISRSTLTTGLSPRTSMARRQRTWPFTIHIKN